MRIAGETIEYDVSLSIADKPGNKSEQIEGSLQSQATRKSWKNPKTRIKRIEGTKKAQKIRRARKGESPYDETHRITGKAQETIELYRAIDRLCLSFSPSYIEKRYLSKVIKYNHKDQTFCSIHIGNSCLRIWLILKYNQIDKPPSFARDVSGIGRWGIGDVELRISNRSELEEAADLIRQSFNFSR